MDSKSRGSLVNPIAGTVVQKGGVKLCAPLLIRVGSDRKSRLVRLTNEWLEKLSNPTPEPLRKRSGNMSDKDDWWAWFIVGTVATLGLIWPVIGIVMFVDWLTSIGEVKY